MPEFRVTFQPSGNSVVVPSGISILEAAELTGELLPAECQGRGACGRCLVRVEEGEVPEYRVLRREGAAAQVLACVTPVTSALTVTPLEETSLPTLIPQEQTIGLKPLDDWSPWPMSLTPVFANPAQDDLGVALDVGTTTLKLALVRLSDGIIAGEAGAYNPQINYGADVISRIMAAEKGGSNELASIVRDAVSEMVQTACGEADLDPIKIRGYVVAGNLTMIHLMLAEDPSGIRLVPSKPGALAFEPREAPLSGLPGRRGSIVHLLPAAGGWVGGDIVAGCVRAGFSRRTEGRDLYVDLGTNGEIVLGGEEYAVACACSAGPAFEGGGIRCGMRADRGAVDGARIDLDAGTLELSVIGDESPRGLCGSGLIALADELLRAGWIDRSGCFTSHLPDAHRIRGKWGKALAIAGGGKVALWERDLTSLIRAKAAVFSGIRTLLGTLGMNAGELSRIVVSGNFGRFLNLPAAVGIGLLPDLPSDRYGYVNNGSLEGAALYLLSGEFRKELHDYLKKITYVDLCDLPNYMDEFVGASFLPHTNPDLLRG